MVSIIYLISILLLIWSTFNNNDVPNNVSFGFLLPFQQSTMPSSSSMFYYYTSKGSRNIKKHYKKKPVINFVVYESSTSSTSSTIIEQCIDAFNKQDLDTLMDCWDDNAVYEDTMLDSARPQNKEQLRANFQRIFTINTLQPPFLQPPKVIIDKIAICTKTDGGNKIGVQWHLESGENVIPFSKGCSFYTTNPQTGKLQTGFHVIETPFKPDDIIFNLLIIPIKLYETISNNNNRQTIIETDDNDNNISILEKAYKYWNNRDIDGAVSCFSDDIILDDTLYIQPIRGKDALKKHYTRVVTQVPATCKIILDDIAYDSIRGTLAAKWHLDVGNNPTINNALDGFSRGCSMYTIDTNTGLITSGLDITETPIKMNQNGLNILFKPIELLKR